MDIFLNWKKQAVYLFLGSLAFLLFGLWVNSICAGNYWCSAQSGAEFDYRHILYAGIGIVVFSIVNLALAYRVKKQ